MVHPLFDVRNLPQLDLKALPKGVPHSIDKDSEPGGLVNRVYDFDGNMLSESRMRDVGTASIAANNDIPKWLKEKKAIWVITYDGDNGKIFAALRIRPGEVMAGHG